MKDGATIPEAVPHDTFDVSAMDPAHSEEWALARRVVASSGFRKSSLLTNFLLYICEQKLRGHQDQLAEQIIGVKALGRHADYNPGDDNIVRNYARMLRQRLEDYFTSDGADEKLRIVIPRGGYVPIFEPNPIRLPDSTSVLSEHTKVKPLPATEQGVNAPRSSRFRRRSLWFGLASLPVLLGAIMVARSRSYRDSPAGLSHQFWGQIFDGQRRTYVVPADSGLAMIQDLTGQEIHLHDYVENPLQQSFPRFDLSQNKVTGEFGMDRFANLTSTADLEIAVALATLPEYAANHPVVRYARDVRMDDLKHANMVLLGGPHANPWLELFDAEAGFRIVFPPAGHLDEKYILNLHPAAGEQASYANGWNGEAHETYTIVAFLPGIDGVGNALLLEGQNMGGTRAAADFVLDRATMSSILRNARLPDGTIGPFEILLETRVVGANAPEAHVVAQRYGLGQKEAIPSTQGRLADHP